jgi:hypothetical protein
MLRHAILLSMKGGKWAFAASAQDLGQSGESGRSTREVKSTNAANDLLMATVCPLLQIKGISRNPLYFIYEQ